ncbi:fibronectin type III domain-containing protein [Chengkuizengella axinellae]|uniref:Fibronectin type III domain-containing protein n=1 Tax=Chengkuizengella axinellae TaxID=3064388 RepID=A0ABT9IU24_9BACL|nr:fibronectin type III domain-containing protein [Chengkuizengella sp. 2205SS18-9]MDP5272860.1 fibronectin type III domain-containing protein [Chengkuizengella sp. 2205SS18-9]
MHKFLKVANMNRKRLISVFSIFAILFSIFPFYTNGNEIIQYDDYTQVIIFEPAPVDAARLEELIPLDAYESGLPPIVSDNRIVEGDLPDYLPLEIPNVQLNFSIMSNIFLNTEEQLGGSENPVLAYIVDDFIYSPDTSYIIQGEDSELPNYEKPGDDDFTYYDDANMPKAAVNSNGTVVEIHRAKNKDDLYWNLGKIQGDTVDWYTWNGDKGRAQGVKYDTGSRPDVVFLNDDTFLEVHHDYVFGAGNKLYYSIGKVDGEDIDWILKGKKLNVEGERPSIAVDDSGKIVVFFSDENTFGRDVIKYNVGKLNNAGNDINWLQKNKSTNQQGKNVSVTMTPDGTIIEAHNDLSETDLHYSIGYLTDDNLMYWDLKGKKYDTGKYPSVAVTSDGTVIETHRGKNDKDVYTKVGKLKGSKIEGFTNGSKFYRSGRQPFITLIDDGRMLQLHKHASKNKAYYAINSLTTDTGSVTVLIDAESKIAEGSKLQLNSQWRLISDQLYSDGEGTTIGWSEAVWQGIEEQESYQFAKSTGVTWTVGGEISFGKKLADVFGLGSLSASFSRAWSDELTETFGNSITISERYIKNHDYKPEPGIPSVGGVYQLNRKFTIIPEQNLQLLIDALESNAGVDLSNDAAYVNPTFTYVDSALKGIVRRMPDPFRPAGTDYELFVPWGVTLTPMPEESLMEISWEPIEDENVIGYAVYRDGKYIGMTSNVEDTTFIDGSIVPGREYTYSVVSYTSKLLYPGSPEQGVYVSQPSQAITGVIPVNPVDLEMISSSPHTFSIVDEGQYHINTYYKVYFEDGKENQETFEVYDNEFEDTRALTGTGTYSVSKVAIDGEHEYESEPSSNYSVPRENGVYLFEDTDYGGEWVRLDEGEYPYLPDVGFEDDVLSSVKVIGDYRVRLYPDRDFGDVDHARMLFGNDKNLGNDMGDNVVSSVKVDRADEGVYFFREEQYMGKYKFYAEGEYQDLPTSTYSSIRVMGDYAAEVFENTNFEGQSTTIFYRDQTLSDEQFDGGASLDNTIDSLKVRKLEEGVYLFEEPDYKGDWIKLDIGDYRSLDSIGITYRALTSIKIVGDYEVSLYKYENFNHDIGQTYLTSNPHLGEENKVIREDGSLVNELDSTFNSAKIKPLDEGVYLFRYSNSQSGEWVELGEGEYPVLSDITLTNGFHYEAFNNISDSDAEEIGLYTTIDGDNRLSSIKIVGDYTATLYEHDNFEGVSQTFTENDTYFTDDLISNDTTSSVLIIQGEDEQQNENPVVEEDNQPAIEEEVVDESSDEENSMPDTEEVVDNSDDSNLESDLNLIQSPNDFLNWNVQNGLIVEETQISNPFGEGTVQNLIPQEVNKGVQQTMDVNPEGKLFSFGIWLKADQDHEAQLKIQNRDNSDSRATKVEVTTNWQYYKITLDEPLDLSQDGDEGVTVVLWPGAYNGTTDSVYAWGASLSEMNLIQSPNDFLDWKVNNGLVVEETDVNAPFGEETVQKLIQHELNKAVQQTVEVSPEGKIYTFGVWLKADQNHEAQIKIQNRDNSDSIAEKVDITTEWQYYKITLDEPLDLSQNGDQGVTVVLWPGTYNGTIESVYAWGAVLVEM